MFFFSVSLQLSAETNNPHYNKRINLSVNDELIISEFFKRYLIKAYSSIGYRLAFHGMSPARAVKQLNAGKLDGLTIRVSSIEKYYPDFVRVPVPLATGDLVLYCHQAIKCDASVLDNPNNVIGIVRGNPSQNQFIDEHRATTYEIRDAMAVSEVFIKGRLNYMLSFNEHNIGSIVFLPPDQFQQIKLSEVVGYHYIHQRFQQYLPEITEALQKAVDEIGPVNRAFFNSLSND